MFQGGTSHRQSLEPDFLCSVPETLGRSDQQTFRQHLPEYSDDRGVAYQYTLHLALALQRTK